MAIEPTEQPDVGGAPETANRPACPPEDEHPVPGLHAAYSTLDKLERKGEWQFYEDAFPTLREARFTEPEEKYWRYYDKPVWLVVVCSTLAVGLFAGQWWWPELRAALGWPQLVADGWIRFGMMVLGAYMAFLAWPNYRPKDWTPQQDSDAAQASLAFHDKIKRH